MEKIAIISDIHSNITALKTVLEDIHSRNISRIFCLGDCITKSSSPDLVVDLLKDSCEIILKGNCDNLLQLENKDLVPHIEWTKNKLGKERLLYLSTLPISTEFYMSGYLIRLFHASPFSLEHMYNPMFSNSNTRYSALELTNPLDLFENTDFIGKSSSDPIPDIIGYGHVHTPNIYRIKNKTIFNPGSVGFPIEMNNSKEDFSTFKYSTLASYMILEGEFDSKELSTISFQLIRIPYDVKQEINNLKNSDYPEPSKTYSIKKLESALPNLE